MAITTHAELLQHLETLRASVASSMQNHMGGASYCEIHKDGRVSGGLKYDEGRLVVIGAALRHARDAVNAESLADEMRAYLLGERDKWRDMLELHQGRANKSIAWIAYAQGGFDACESLLTTV